ncbi:hypothetical protein [Paracoccus sp. T5]|uniref:hypothetical protein n=1 Tax=Paracoccus sp. T5 TaxID=3402161 RepID=UPI003AECEF83
MTTETNDFCVCMKVQRDDNGNLTQLLFRHADGAFGTFEDAEYVLAPAEEVDNSQQLVRVDQLVDTLAGMISFRDRLDVIPDFRTLPHDRHGMPNVLKLKLACEACSHVWQVQASVIGTTQECPRCKSHGYVDLGKMEWVGPRSPILQALWGRLPGPERLSVLLRDDLELVSLGRTIRLQHAQGYSLHYEAGDVGVRLTVVRDGGGQPVVVHVDEDHTTVTVTEGMRRVSR